MRCPIYNSDLEDPNLTARPGRILALDVGKKRIGLAVSDELGLTAQGIDTLQRRRIREDLSQLKAIATQWNIHTLLIGRPLHMSGDESRQSEYTREFAERAAEHLDLPVVLWDERLTTTEAHRHLDDAGHAGGRERKGIIDQVAAVLILQSFLEARANERSRS